MEKIMKVFMEIGKYFKENYRTNVFQKLISLLVVVCLIINIANLPAFASEKRAIDNKEKNEQVVKSGKTSDSEMGLQTSQEAMRSGRGEGVGRMNAVGNMSKEEVDKVIEIDAKNGVIRDKTKGNKVVAVYNAEKGQVLGYAGQKDIVYYQALVNRKNFLDKGGAVVQKEEQKTTEKTKTGINETVKIEKTAKEIAEVKGTVIGEYKSTSKTAQTSQSQNQGIVSQNVSQEKAETKATEQTENKVVEKISQNTGVSKEDVKNNLDEALKGKSKEEKETVIGLLKTFFDNGGDIVNCAVEALVKVLDIQSKGVLGLQALLVEISTGLFVKNNEDLINSGQTQLMTSMSTMQQVMQQYGVDAQGYSAKIEDFIANTKTGENAVVWVNKDHYITVTKLENGNYSVADSNVNNGKAVEYSAEGLKNVLSAKEGVDVNGNKVGVSYNAQAKDGTIKVLSASEGLKQAQEEGTVKSISKEEMVEFKGAAVRKDIKEKIDSVENMSKREIDNIIYIDEKNGVIYDRTKGNKIVAYYDAEKKQVRGQRGQEDIIAYYQALVNRKLFLEKGYKAPKLIGNGSSDKTITDKKDKNKTISFENDRATIKDSKTGETKEIEFDKKLSREELKKQKDFIANYGIAAWEDRIRGEGLVKQETLLDKDGLKIYVATKVGYDSNSHTIAMEYNFYQPYTDDIYFVNSQGTKLLVQSYEKDNNGLLKQDIFMLYSVATNAKVEEYELVNGIKVSMSISNLDRIVEKGNYVEKNSKGEKLEHPYQEYRIIDYSNPNNANNGIPTSLELVQVRKDGHKFFSRLELANSAVNSNKKDSSKESSKAKSTSPESKKDDKSDKDTDEDDVTKEYKQMLEKTSKLKVKDYDELYEGYKYVDQSYIIGFVSYSTQTTLYTRTCGIGNWNITVNAEGIGSDWRNLKVLPSGSKISVQCKGVDISGKTVMYMASGELNADSAWEDIPKNLKVEPGNIVVCGYTKNAEGKIVYDPFYRVSGKYDEKKGFYGADLGEYSDYYGSVKTENGESVQVYNVKRTKDGKYVAQENKEDVYASTYYVLKEKSKLIVKDESGNKTEIGKEKERDTVYNIKEGTIFEKNEKNDVIIKDKSGKDSALKEQSNKMSIRPDQEDLEIMESYYKETWETRKKTITDWWIFYKNVEVTTTRTVRYAVWNEKDGSIELHTTVTTASSEQSKVLGGFISTESEKKITITDNGVKVFETHIAQHVNFFGFDDDELLHKAFEKLYKGEIDFSKQQLKYLEQAGIEIKKYDEGSEHRVDIIQNVPRYTKPEKGRYNGNLVQVYQITRTYSTDGKKINNIKYDENNNIIKQPLSVQIGFYYLSDGAVTPDPKTGNIFNAKGFCTRTDYYYKKNGDRIVIGHGSFEQKAFIGIKPALGGAGKCVGTEVIEGTYYRAKEKINEDGEVVVDIDGNTVYETENGEIKYEAQNWKGRVSFSPSAEEVIEGWFRSLSEEEKAKMRIEVKTSDGKTVILQLCSIEGKLSYESVGLPLSCLSFNRSFSGNEGDWSFTINGIKFDPSQGFYVDANVQLTDKEFKVKGNTTINAGDSDDDEGDSPKKVKKKKYGVLVSIDGEDMILKAEPGSRSEVSITFGLNELTSESLVIGNYSFGYFYAGTEITFFEQEQKTIKSENTGKRDVSNASVTAGDVVNQKITVSGIKNGSKVLLKINTGLGELAGAIADSGFTKGSATVVNEIEFEKKGGTGREYVKIEAKMVEGKEWKDAKKTFYYKGQEKSEYQLALKGESMLGGKYNGDCEVKLGFWDGYIDFNSSATQIKMDRNWFVGIVTKVMGVATAIVGYVSLCFGIGYFILKYSAAPLLTDKKQKKITNKDVLAAGIAGLIGAVIIVITILSLGSALAVIAPAGTAVGAATATATTAAATAAATAATTAATTAVSAALVTGISVVLGAVGVYTGTMAAFNATQAFIMYAKTGDTDYLTEAIINLILVVISIVSAFGLGGGATSMATKITSEAAKEALKTGLKVGLACAGVGVGVGIAAKMIINKINGKSLFEEWWKGALIGAIAGFCIGFSIGFSSAMSGGAGGASSVKGVVKNYFSSGWSSFMKAGKLAKAGQIFNAALKAVNVAITISQASNIIQSFQKGDIGSALSSLYILFTIHVINNLMSQQQNPDQKEASFRDIAKRTSGMYKLNANGQLVFSKAIFARSLIFGAVGFGIGYGIGVAVNKIFGEDGEDVISPFAIAAVVGLLMYGASSAIATGGYKNFSWNNIRNGLVGISEKTFTMTHRMMQFNLEVQYLGAFIGLARYGLGAKKLSEDDSLWARFIKKVDSFIGFNAIKSAEELIYDKEGNFSFFDSKSVSNIAVNSATNVYSSSSLMFSAGTAIFVPLLGPALLASPVLGTLMQTLNWFQSGLQNRGLESEFLDTFFEEGFKENLAGLLGSAAFGDSQFGEIFQELFDETPDGNYDMDFLNSESQSLVKSKNITQQSFNNAVQSIKEASRNESLRQTTVDTLNKQFGISDNVINDLIDSGQSIEEIGNSFVKEIVLTDMKERKLISEQDIDDFKSKLTGVDLNGLSFTQQVNYVFGLATVYVSNKNKVNDNNNIDNNINNNDNVNVNNKSKNIDENNNVADLNNLTTEQLENTTMEGLLNLVSVYGGMYNKGNLVLAISNIIYNRILKVVEEMEKIAETEQEKTAKDKAIMDAWIVGNFGKISAELKGLQDRLNALTENNEEAPSKEDKDEIAKIKEKITNIVNNNTNKSSLILASRVIEAIVSNAEVPFSFYLTNNQFINDQKTRLSDIQRLIVRATNVTLKGKFDKDVAKLDAELHAINGEIARLKENTVDDNKKILLQAKAEVLTDLKNLATNNKDNIAEYYKLLHSYNSNALEKYKAILIEQGTNIINNDLRLAEKFSKGGRYVLSVLSDNYSPIQGFTDSLKQGYIKQIKSFDVNGLLSFNMDALAESMYKSFNMVDLKTINIFESQVNSRKEIVEKLQNNINGDIIANKEALKNFLSFLGHDNPMENLSEAEIKDKVRGIVATENEKIMKQQQIIVMARIMVNIGNQNNMVDLATINSLEEQVVSRETHVNNLARLVEQNNAEQNNAEQNNIDRNQIKSLLSQLGYDSAIEKLSDADIIKKVKEIATVEKEISKKQKETIEKAKGMVKARDNNGNVLNDVDLNDNSVNKETSKLNNDDAKKTKEAYNIAKELMNIAQQLMYNTGIHKNMIENIATEKSALINEMTKQGKSNKEYKDMVKYYDTRMQEIGKMTLEDSMSGYFNTNQFALNTQQSQQTMEKLKEQYNGIKDSNDANITTKATMEIFFGQNGIFNLLTNPDYGKDIKKIEADNDQVKEKIKEAFSKFAEGYWNKFDTALINFIKNYNQEHADKQITSAQQLREFINSADINTITDLKDKMIKSAFGNSKTDDNLVFTERLALDLKISEIAYGSWDLSINDNELSVKYNNDKGYGAGTTLLNYGKGILGANSTVGTNTGNQVLMMCESLLGRISSLSAGGGKTHVYGWTIDMYFSLNNDPNQLNIAEIFGAKSTDAAQLSGKAGKADDNVKFMWTMMKMETANGEQQYQDCSKTNNYNELASSYTKEMAQGYKGRVVTFSLGTRGFVELQARVGEHGAELNKALDKATIRIVDEADVAALSKTAFVLATGNSSVNREKASAVVKSLQKLQSIEVNEKRIQANTEAKSKEDLAVNEFTIIDGKIICSNQLEEEILKTFKNPAIFSFFNKQSESLDKLEKYQGESEISNVMRAMYAMQSNANNIETVAFVDGQPASIQAGSQSNNTTDQSQSYNVALVALKIQELKRAEGVSEQEILNMKLKDYKYGKEGSNVKYDIYNVKTSVSSGESTISQIVSRNQNNTLNFGASATLDVAREVAQTLFGGIAVDIEASSINKIMGQYNIEGQKNRFNVYSVESNKSNETNAKEQIVQTNVEKAVAFLKGENRKKDGKNADVGLLFGAMDMSYNTEIMIRALAQLSQGQTKSFTYEDIIKATKGYTVTQIVKYIADNYTEMKSYTDQIQIIDADTAGNNSDAVALMAQTRGKLTFSNESGLRGVNFQSIDMVILDGHNFPVSELLQAIGRAGRNGDWGKDKASVDVYMDQNSIDATIDSMKKTDQYLQQNKGRGLFKATDKTAGGLNLNDIIRGNIEPGKITSVDYLELVSVYKAMQLKSESILFKANQEAMYILVKEPLAEMAKKARDNGDIEGAQFLTNLYNKAISNDEGNLFGKASDGTTDGELTDPITTMKQTFSRVLTLAETYLTVAQDHQFKDSSINISFANRLLDVKKMSEDGAFDRLIDAQADNDKPYFDSSFAKASRDVNFSKNASPAEDIAKTLIKLSIDVLPTASSSKNDMLSILMGRTGVTAESAIKVTDSMNQQEANAYIEKLNTDVSLHYINSSGERVLTEKGKIYALFANRNLIPNRKWLEFFNKLLSITGSENIDNKADKLAHLVDSLWKKNIRNSKSVEVLLNLCQMIDTNPNMQITIETIQQIINTKYDEDFKDYVKNTLNYQLPPAQVVWLAKNNLLADKVLQDTIINNYNEIRRDFNEFTIHNIIKQQELGGFVHKILYGTKMSGESESAGVGWISAVISFLSNLPKLFSLLFSSGIKNILFGLSKGINKIPWFHLGYTGKAKEIHETINPNLEDLLSSLVNINDDKELKEIIKTKMVLAGCKIDEKTDTAIENMKAYLDSLSPDVSERVKKKLSINDIHRFANMPKLIKSLADTRHRLFWKLIYLSEHEKSVLNGLLSAKSEITIDVLKELVVQMTSKDIVEKPSERIKEDEVLKIAFKMMYPNLKQEASNENNEIELKEINDDNSNVDKKDKSVEDLIKRYNCITNNKELLNVFGSMSVSEIMNDDNFVKVERELYVTEKFKNKYKELLENLTYSELNKKIENKEKSNDNDNELKKNENNNIINNENNNINNNENNNENNNINNNENNNENNNINNNENNNIINEKPKQDGEKKQPVKDMLKGNIDKLKNEGIDYYNIEKKYNEIVTLIKDKLTLQDSEKEQDKKQAEAQKIAETFKIKDLSNDKLVEQLKTALSEDYIELKEETTREDIIKAIKNLQLNKIANGFDYEKIKTFIDENNELLKMAELDVDAIKTNIETMKDLFNKSEFKDSIKMIGLQWRMNDLSQTSFKKDTLYSKTVKKIIREMYEEKKYSELLNSFMLPTMEKKTIKENKIIKEFELVDDMQREEEPKFVDGKEPTEADLTELGAKIFVDGKEPTEADLTELGEKKKVGDKIPTEADLKKVNGKIPTKADKKTLESSSMYEFMDEKQREKREKRELEYKKLNAEIDEAMDYNRPIQEAIAHNNKIAEITKAIAHNKKIAEITEAIAHNKKIENAKKHNDEILSEKKKVGDKIPTKADLKKVGDKIPTEADLVKKPKEKTDEEIMMLNAKNLNEVRNYYIDLQNYENAKERNKEIKDAMDYNRPIQEAISYNNKLDGIIQIREENEEARKYNEKYKEYNELASRYNEKVNTHNNNAKEENKKRLEAKGDNSINKLIERIGFDKLEKNKKKLGKKLKDEERDKIINNMKVEELNNETYVTAIIDLLDAKIIKEDQIENMKEKIADKTYIEIVRKFNNDADKADKVLKNIGMAEVLANKKILMKLSNKKIYELAIMNMTIKELSDKKEIVNMDLKQLDAKVNELLKGDINDDKIENLAFNEEEKYAIKTAILQKAMEKGAVDETKDNKKQSIFSSIVSFLSKNLLEEAKKLDPTKQGAVIAGIFAQKSTREIEINDNTAFADKKVLGVENVKIKLKDLMKATGTRTTLMNPRELQKGMMLVLQNSLNKDTVHVITVMEVKNDEIVYVANVKGKNEAITRTISRDTLSKGVTLSKDGTLVEAKEAVGELQDMNAQGQVIQIQDKLKWKGLVLATDKAINKSGGVTLDKIQEIFNMDKDLTEKLTDSEGLQTLFPIINGIILKTTESVEVKAIANMLGKDVSSLTQSDIANIFNKKDNLSDKEIMDTILERLGELSTDKSAKGRLVVELTAVAGGLWLAMKMQGAENVKGLDKTKVNGNQATISKLLKDEYDKHFKEKGNDKDFVINLSAVREGVETKQVYTVEERANILSALAGNSQSLSEEATAVADMFKMKNIKAIAKAA